MARLVVTRTTRRARSDLLELEDDPDHLDHDDQERELLIASIDELTQEDRRHVAALVESLRHSAARDGAGDG